MASSNEKILNEILKRQIYLERYKNGFYERMSPTVEKAIADVRAKIARLPANSTRAHLQSVLREVVRINEQMSKEMQENFEEELKRLAVSEAVFTTSALTMAMQAKKFDIKLGVPSDAFLSRMVKEEPFQGLVLKEWTKRVGTSASMKAREQLFIGLAEGEGIEKIVKRFDFIGDQTKNDLRMVTRTSVNAIANNAKSAVYSENADVLKAVQWKATLDGRTSLICASRDGEQYPLDNHPTPPAHPNCRSVLVPIIKSFAEMGIRGLMMPDEGTRASMNGQVPAKQNYGQWLRGQPREFINDVLGPARAELFVRNKLTLDKFVDDTGRKYTLEELDSMYKH